MRKRFRSKRAAREAVWSRLEEQRAARFPYPPQGRIPNFEGARRAAERLLETPPLEKARRVKVNPDAPQRPVREDLLRRGVVIYMPTPRLRGGFRRLDPQAIPERSLGKAASLSGSDRWAEEAPLRALPRMDAIVCGSVAVTRGGRRCGKGEGYSDLEYAVLRELGHPPAPVVTSVHALQVVEDFPADANDLPLSWIATPEETIEVESPGEGPAGIDWSLLSEEDLEAMPVLRGLRR